MMKGKYFSIYWGICVVILAIITHPLINGDIRFIKDIYFVFFALISLLVFGLKGKMDILLPVFAFLTGNIYNEFFLYQFVCFIFGYLLLCQAKHFGLTDFFIESLFILSIIQSIWFMLNYINLDPQEWINNLFNVKGGKFFLQNGKWVNARDLKQLVVGSLGQHTLSGVLILVGIPQAIKRKWPLLFIAPGIILTNSTMVQLSALVMLIYYFSKSIKLVLSTIFLLSIIFILDFKIEYLSGQERLTAWKWGLNNFNILGNGLGYWSKHFPINITKERFLSAHNEFLELIFAFGLIALPVLYCYLRDAFRKQNNLIFKIILFGLLFNSLGNLTFHISPIAVIGILLLGALNKEVKNGFFIN